MLPEEPFAHEDHYERDKRVVANDEEEEKEKLLERVDGREAGCHSSLSYSQEVSLLDGNHSSDTEIRSVNPSSGELTSWPKSTGRDCPHR